MENTFQKNLMLWSEKKSSSYEYTLERQCFCPIEYRRPIRITVEDNEVIGANFFDENEVSTELFNELETIDDWFIIISDAINRHADQISIKYNAKYGYPEMLDIDMRLLRSDD